MEERPNRWRLSSILSGDGNAAHLFLSFMGAVDIDAEFMPAVNSIELFYWFLFLLAIKWPARAMRFWRFFNNLLRCQYLCEIIEI